MKILMSCLLMITASFAFSQETAGDNPVDWSIDLENRAASEGGTLTGAPTFDRRWAVGTNLGCAAPSSDSSQDGVPYVTFPLRTSVVENLQIEVLQEAVPTTIDSVLFIYCGTFNPAMPDQNLVFWDDNDGQDLLSAVLPSDGIQLTPDTDYTLVITGYDSGQTGAFAVTAAGATTLPVELSMFSVE